MEGGLEGEGGREGVREAMILRVRLLGSKSCCRFVFQGLGFWG